MRIITFFIFIVAKLASLHLWLFILLHEYFIPDGKIKIITDKHEP